tara:strand:+ start:27275 stop:28561 length:1287 start_codon:yes stop_codon:yes gene_type:complete
MKKLKYILTLTLFISLGIFNALIAQVTYGPPEPPVGKRWILNEDFSDEFNGTELDSEKWFDYHPKWKGREPGIFLPSQVSVKDGFLQIKGEKLKKDTIVKAYGRELKFNIAGGAVISKKAAFLGYFETRVKAAATTMSTTFWFSTVNSVKGPNGCDSYGLEWDIHESIGRGGDFKGNFFANGMNSNGHFWYTDCDGKKYDLRAPSVKFTNKDVSSKDFHVYGGWWKDENTAISYYDKSAPKQIKFYDKILAKPFNQPMRMRLVSETYPFPWIELPTNEELADPTKNTVYYDWVRGYDLVDVNEKDVDQSYEIGLNLYDESVVFSALDTDLEVNDELKIPISFKANKHRKIYIKVSEMTDRLKEKWNKKIFEKTIDVYPGYGNIEVVFNVDKKISKSATYIVEALIREVNGESKPHEALDLSTMFFTIH